MTKGDFDCIVLRSRFSRTHFYRILPTYSLFLLPVYSHVLTSILCFYRFVFFFAPEGNTEHLLRKVEEKKWLARMFVYNAIDAQRDETTIAAAALSRF